MPSNIYTLDNRYFRSEAFRVYKWIEKATRLPIKTGQSTIWEYMGTPAQDLLIEGDVTLDDLKNIFPNGTALDKYGWTIPVDSVYIRVIPITPCEDETAQRVNGTEISEEDMEYNHMKVHDQRVIEILSGHQQSEPFFTTSTH